MPASALPKNALGVRADPKGQVLLTPHTPKPHQKGAEKLISAEDAAQVAEAVGRERTSACLKWPQLAVLAGSLDGASGYALRSRARAVQLAMWGRSANN